MPGAALLHPDAKPDDRRLPLRDPFIQVLGQAEKGPVHEQLG